MNVIDVITREEDVIITLQDEDGLNRSVIHEKNHFSVLLT